MVNQDAAEHPAFGVSDAREKRGLTAKTPKRQKREREKIGGRSAPNQRMGSADIEVMQVDSRARARTLQSRPRAMS
jgi:hypothetical protein